MTWEEAAKAIQWEQEQSIVVEIQEALAAEHPVVFGASGPDAGAFCHAWGSGWQAERKPIPRTKLGASIWHLMGWCWLSSGPGLPFTETAPPVDLQIP